MTYTVSRDPDSRFIELSFWEPAGVEEHLYGREVLLREMMESGIDDGLILLNDCQLDKAFTKTASFSFGRGWDVTLRGKAHVAVVLPEDIKSQNEAYFIINIAKRDGFILQPFYNREQAIDWLSQPR